MDGAVRFWEAASGKQVGVVTQHRSWVNAVAFAPDGTLATGSSDNTVRLLREKTKKDWLVKEIVEFGVGEVRSLAFAPDSKKLAIGLRYGALSLRDWSGDALRVLELPGHDADVWAVAFSSDGKTLASGDGDWDRPGQVILWDAASGKKKDTLKHSNEVLSLAFSPDGDRLAAGGWDGVIHLWKLKK
jgi:WD40 repeat protein